MKSDADPEIAAMAEIAEVAPVNNNDTGESNPPPKRRYVIIAVVFIVTLIVVAGLLGGVLGKRSVDASPLSNPPPPADEIMAPDQVTYIGVGCYDPESSRDAHRLSSSNTDNRAYECSRKCLTRFFGVVSDGICNCFVDVPSTRLSIGSCDFAETSNTNTTMELYFNEETRIECSQERTATVRNFLVEEDDAPFGFDIISNTFRSSPFELFMDECGTNIYEVQTEVSEGSSSLQTSIAEIKSYARSRRTETASSLSTSASGSYGGFLGSVSVEVSASSDKEQVNLFQSSGASEDNARVFSSLGVKRLAEVKIVDFDNTDRFVTFSRPFGNLLRSYKQSNFNRNKAYEILETYGQFVLTRGIFGGYMQLRTTMSGQDVSNSFSSEQSAKDCYEASVSVEASGFGFSGKASADVSGCSAENVQQFLAQRSQFATEVSEETVVGGRKENGEFVVEAQTSTLLTSIDQYPANDRTGVQFRLLSDFLAPEKISPLEVKRLQINEDEFGIIQTNLQIHILEYLQGFSDLLGGCNCTAEALPYLSENEDGNQACSCYDPSESDFGTKLSLSPGGTWSKQGQRRTCAWDRCPSSGFQWNNVGGGCSCQGGLNTCYMEGQETTVDQFDEVELVPILGFDPNFPIWKLQGSGDHLMLGQGGDCATGSDCFSDELRGGFRVDLSQTPYEFVQDSKVTVTGWSPRLRVEADGGTWSEDTRIHAEAGEKSVIIPEGTKTVEAFCGGWCGGCTSELYVTRV